MIEHFAGFQSLMVPVQYEFLHKNPSFLCIVLSSNTI
jgi:hypothetical protein